MSIYAGLDVSDKTTHVCVVDAEGAILRREVLASDPDLLAKWLARYCPTLVRVVLETGPLSAFLYHGLAARDVPVECICARHVWIGGEAGPRRYDHKLLGINRFVGIGGVPIGADRDPN